MLYQLRSGEGNRYLQEQKKERGVHYSNQLKAKVRRYACENRNTATSTKLSLELGSKMSLKFGEKYEEKYLQKLHKEPNCDKIVSLLEDDH